MTQPGPSPDQALTQEPRDSYETGQLANVAAAVRGLGHPTQIGPYHILTLIGEGGMGTVYKAEQRVPIRRTVAIKIVKLGMDTRQVIARFESERQALALMNHPNVANVLDAGATETGRPYFVMEFVPGEPITHYADRYKLTVRQRLELFAQACEAVQHAHQRAIIHRDLKPSNILVSQQDDRATVKVIDFGVAKATAHKLTERTLFTETGQLVGTPEYMSPEQADASVEDIDTRSDVYSLGVVLYELLSGALPFDAKTLRGAGYEEIQRIIRDTDPPRPSTRLSRLGAAAQEVARLRQVSLDSLARQLHSELEWIPLKAMHKDRGRRYSSATELAEDVRNYLESRPLRAAPESAAYRVRKFVRRHKTAVVVSGAMVFLLLAGIVATSWQALRATRAERNVRAALGTAEEAGARAQAINDFLIEDVLQAATPDITRGRPLGVAEALDNAARTIDGRFNDKPGVKSAVHAAVASAYRELGNSDAALAHARAAMKLCEQQLDPDDRVSLSAKTQLGLTLIDRGNLDEAEPLIRDVFDRARRKFAADDEVTILATRHLGGLELGRGRVQEAEDLGRHALALARRRFGDEHDQTLSCMSYLSIALRSQGKHGEAEPLLREALRTCLRLRGDDHPSTLNAMNTLGVVLQEQGKLTEAVALKRDAVAKARRVYGDDHLMTIAYVSNLADAMAHAGKEDEAMPYFREVLERSRRVLGPDHHSTLAVANNFARILDNRGEWEEAQQLYRDAVERGRAARGIGHPDVMVSILNYSRALALHGQLEPAESLQREALGTARTNLGEDHRLTMALMQELADVLRQARKLEEAETLAREALGRRQRTLAKTDPDVVSSMRALIDVLLEQRRYDEAEPMAAELYRLCAGSEMNPRFMAQCMSKWGISLALMERFDQAEAPLREAHRRLVATRTGSSNAALRAVVSALASVCDATNRPDEATRWRQSLTTATSGPVTQPAK